MFKILGIVLITLCLGVLFAWEPLLCAQREDVFCPQCARPARIGKHWVCGCGKAFDTFEHRGRCPGCRNQWHQTQCLACSQWSDHAKWYTKTLLRTTRTRRPLLNVQARATETRCPFCHDDLGRRGLAECGACAAPHHRECWTEHGGCASCVVGRDKRAA